MTREHPIHLAHHSVGSGTPHSRAAGRSARRRQARRGHAFELITATVRLDDGSEGTGYTCAGGRGGAAVRAMIRHALAPWLAGSDATDVEALHQAMQWHVHHGGRGGIASFAISAVDIALWDLRGQSLAQTAGGASDRCRAYATGIPLALGENLRTIREFEKAFARSKLAGIQADASNCGGITSWLQVARRARELGVPVCSHGMQELHVCLMAGQPHAGWLEVHSFPTDEYTRRLLVVDQHMAVAPSTPGIGVQFDWMKLAPLEVALT